MLAQITLTRGSIGLSASKIQTNSRLGLGPTGTGNPHDRLSNSLVRRGLLGRRLHDLDLRSRIHAKEFVLALPDADREQATLDIAGVFREQAGHRK